jgi:hypothetical protein
MSGGANEVRAIPEPAIAILNTDEIDNEVSNLT